MSQKKLTRRTALKAGGVAAVGRAFSKPIIETIYPQPAFAQLSALEATSPTPTPGAPLAATGGYDPNGWVEGAPFLLNDWAINIAVGGNPEVVYLHLDEEVYKFDLNGNRLYTFHSGVYPFSEAGFGGFAVAPNDGVLWMTHYWKDAIEGINPDGTSAASHLQSYSSGNGQFDRPSGLTVAIDGSLYVVDEKNFQVQKLQQRFGLPGPIGEARALETVNSCNRWTSPWIFWAILM